MPARPGAAVERLADACATDRRRVTRKRQSSPKARTTYWTVPELSRFGIIANRLSPADIQLLIDVGSVPARSRRIVNGRQLPGYDPDEIRAVVSIVGLDEFRRK